MQETQEVLMHHQQMVEIVFKNSKSIATLAVLQIFLFAKITIKY
jgi:hypothetical protein